MKGWIQRTLALTLALLCFCSGAAAEFSPACASLLGREETLLRMSFQVDSAPDWAAGSREAASALLEDVTAAVILRGGDEMLLVDRAGENVFSVARRHTRDYTVAFFGPSGGAYITAPDEKDAFSLLAGAEEFFLPDGQLIADYPGMGSALFSTLAEHRQPKLSRQSTSIKNTAGSASFELYVFADGELTEEIWTQALEGLLPSIRVGMSHCPQLLGQVETLLRGAEFSGECRFKRFLDRDGQDMGLQFTGDAAWGEDKRKVTLYFGFTPDQGGYFSLNLPAVKGKNSLKLALEYRLTEKNSVKNLTAAFSLSRTLNGEATAAQGDAKLKNEIKDGKENWSGSISFSRTEHKIKTSYTLIPSLKGDEAGMEGTVRIAYQEGKKGKTQWTANVSLLPGEAVDFPTASAARDLRGMEEDAARAVVAGEWTRLAGPIARALLSLPEEARWALSHQLRTDAWMNGPAEPARENQDEAPIPAGWIAEEEENQ